MAEGSPQRILEQRGVAHLPPALIIQGEVDNNLTPDMADRFGAAYRAAGERPPCSGSPTRRTGSCARTGQPGRRSRPGRRRRVPGQAGGPLMTVLGDGAYAYEVNQDWARMPDGWAFGDVAGVGVDSLDRVYVFNRGPHPMMVFDRDGRLLTSWGEDVFPHPHAVHVTADDYLYLTDDGDHTVRKCTTDGEVLLELGSPGRPAPFMSGRPFHRCTHTALAPDGDIWVTDGYGNARLHRYSPSGELRWSFGQPGAAGGVQPAAQHRLRPGWNGLRRRPGKSPGADLRRRRPVPRRVAQPAPAGRAVPGSRPGCVAGGGDRAGHAVQPGRPNLGPRITVLGPDGALITRLSDDPSAWTGAVPVAARHRGRLGGRPVRRPGLGHRLAAAVPRRAGSLPVPEPAEAHARLNRPVLAR